MTAVTLAEIVGVSPQAIHNYEAASSTPSPRVVEGLTVALNLPTHFFFQDREQVEPVNFYFRSINSATKAARVRAQRRAVWLCDLVGYLSSSVEFPPVDLPEFNLSGNPHMLLDGEIETTADLLRNYWGMRHDPVANMIRLLENHGVVISRGPLGDAKLDGLSAATERPVVMIGTDKGTSARWRFDAAHELAHLVLHAHLDPKTLVKQADHKLIEDQAHRFAGAFLLPLDSFGDDFFAASLDALQSIKPKWRVSIGAMIKRARHGGLIDEATERKLWINYTRRGWRRLEPYDEGGTYEEPALVGAAVKLLVTNGRRDDLLQKVALPAFDIESLASLEPGWLSTESPASLRLLPRERESRDVVTVTDRTAAIYNFPGV